MRKPFRKSLRETVEDNQQTLTSLAKLYGAPAPVFSEILKEKRPRVKATKAATNHPTEAQILKTVLAFLRVHPRVAFVMRVNSGTFVESFGGHERYIQSNSQPGMSDTCGMLHGGQFFVLEMKSQTGRVTQAQDDFILKIIQGGGLGGVCRSVEDAIKILGFE